MIAIRNITWILIVLLGSMWASTSFARDPKLAVKQYPDSAIFKASLEKGEVPTAGKTFKVRIHVKVRQPYHIWSSTMADEGGLIPLRIKIPDSLKEYFQLVDVKEQSKPVIGYDSNFQQVTKAIHKPFDLIATIKVLRNSKTPVPFFVHLIYQTCDEIQCLPPAMFNVPMDVIGDKPLMIKIAYGTPDTTAPSLTSLDSGSSTSLNRDSTTRMGQVAGGSSSAPPSAPNAAVKATATATTGGVGGSLWQVILLAAGGGLLALLTPCVFPMVPITISFFTKRNAGSKKEAAKDALLYAAGIILPFVLFGFILTLVWGEGAINSFAANPVTNVVTSVIFLTFALNLFGLFEIGLPSSVVTKLNISAQQSKSRVFSVMLMGVVFSLTSFTCTVPIVGTLMSAFSHGAFFYPLIGMLVYATIFAAPFVVLAFVPNALKSLPRSGTWMNNVKVVLGFVELGAALLYLSKADFTWSLHLITRDMVLACLVALAILITVYVLGRFRLSHDTPVEHIGAIRALFAVFFLSIGIYLYTGFNGRPLGQFDGFLPPADYGDGSQSVATTSTNVKGTPTAQVIEQWIPSYPTALAEAKKTGKNIFIDFTGYSCTNCRAMEATVFSRQDVKQMFQNFVLARLYTDKGDALNDSNRTMEESRFNTIALPFYVIVSPDDKPLATFPGYTRNAEDFKSFLRLEHPNAEPAVAMLTH